MDDETTTPESVDTGVEQTQPVDVETTEAVETPEVDTEEQVEAAPESAEPSVDEDAELSEWASKKGLELDSDNTKKAAKMAREAEKAFHAKSQKASELEKAATTASDEIADSEAIRTGQDPELLRRLQRVEIKNTVSDFYESNPDARQYDALMGEIATERPHLAGDLDALYATAVVKSGGVAAVKSQGKREGLADLAHRQQAAVPRGNATTSGTPKGKDFKDLSISEMEKKLGFVRQ